MRRLYSNKVAGGEEMSDYELKKKIIDIISNLEWKDYFGIYHRGAANGLTEAIADALIAAGIGDVKEEERRAEVAERALKEFAVQVGCEDCPFWEGCNYSEPIPTNDFQCCFNMYLQEAEIKLAKEERKDD